MTFNEKTAFIIEVFNHPDIKDLFIELQKTNEHNFNNIMIGGSWALHLHGLNTQDLLLSDIDLIMYLPSSKQKKLAQKIYDASLMSDLKKCKTIKKKLKNLKKKNFFDFIIERYSKPRHTVLFNFSDELILPVNPIYMIIKNRKKYIRPKDIENNLFLKENNF